MKNLINNKSMFNSTRPSLQGGHVAEYCIDRRVGFDILYLS